MKTMKKFLSMAALAMVGAVTVGCTSEDNAIDQAQTATKNNVVTQTVTVGFDEQAATRALAIDYTHKKLTKTFEAGDQIAVIYENESGTMVKAETAALTADDITAEGKSAKFTVTMTKPKKNGTLKYIYPAAMAGATDVDYTKLNTQNGTLASLASNLDLATFEGTLTDASELPASASLTNKLAILALTFKNSDGTSPLTGINKMILSDGTNIYSITGKDDDGHIYAAIQPTTAFSCIATDGTNNYAKSLTGKNYAANTIYDLGLKMEQPTDIVLSGVTVATTIQNGTTLTGTLDMDNKVKISIADGAIVTLNGARINGWYGYSYQFAGITCEGNATIILEGENRVSGFADDYPGIYVPSGKTLTIQGTGSLKVGGNDMAAGIGGGNNISCGNIVISGGDITAMGGSKGAGIGGGFNASCGNITITSGVTRVKANAGIDANSIGAGYYGTCGTVTIDGVANATTSSTFTNFDSSASGNTWTLTHK